MFRRKGSSAKPAAQRCQDFVFFANPKTPTPGKKPMLTGHENGTITINVAEADDSERERLRTTMGEPYRTLLGHFRHEIGHYYWDRLIAGKPAQSRYRALFGDERADYEQVVRADLYPLDRLSP